jgi:hypothetical protein
MIQNLFRTKNHTVNPHSVYHGVLGSNPRGSSLEYPRGLLAKARGKFFFFSYSHLIPQPGLLAEKGFKKIEKILKIFLNIYK